MISDGMKLIAYCALVLLLTGCSSISLPQPRAYSAEVAELLSGRVILGREVTDADLPNIDLFAITPEMEAFAKRAVRRGDSYFEKVKALHVALLTSAEAGGYDGLTPLALARSAGARSASGPRPETPAACRCRAGRAG